MPDPRQDLADELARVLAPVLPEGAGSVCFIDPPAQPNVGDPVIFLGELEFLRRHRPGYRPWFVDRDHYADHMERWIERSDLILIQGGGNLGDIWPDPHDFRLRIMERFAHKKIVQMPQSVHFSDPARVEEMARLIARQRDFTLLVRDDKSQAFASAAFSCPVLLAPDMAFAMPALTRPPPRLDVLCLLRTDKEAASDHRAIVDALRRRGASFEVADWLDETTPDLLATDRRAVDRLRRRPVMMHLLRTASLRARERYGRGRLAVGIELLSRGRIVVTDRLHAHIMCCLLGIPHFAFDSFDGKISAMYRTWTHRFPMARMVNSPQELEDILAVA